MGGARACLCTRQQPGRVFDFPQSHVMFGFIRIFRRGDPGPSNPYEPLLAAARASRSWCKACFSDYMQQKKLCPPVPVASRMCSICKQSKAADEFIRDARTSTGLDARCRECRRQQNLSKKAQHQAGAMQTLAEKQCKHCHMVKPASEFKRHFFTNTGLVRQAMSCR